MSEPLAGNLTLTFPVAEIVNNSIREMFIIVIRHIITSLACLFSICTNVINILTFVKHDLSSSINISFLALSTSDTLRSLILLWMCISSLQYFNSFNSDIAFNEIIYLTSSWPIVCVNRISLYITAYITIERCVSIAAPLRVKTLLSPPKTIAVLIGIVLINVMGLIPEYMNTYFDWGFDLARNRSVLSLRFGDNMVELEKITFITQTFFLIGALFSVIFFTGVLVIKFKSHAEWRRKNARGIQESDAMSLREKHVVKMVIVVATIMIVCFMPSFTVSILLTLLSEISVTGRQVNLFDVLGTFCFLLSVLSADLNIFIYYTMSSKYRTIVKSLLLCRRGQK